MVHKLSNFEFIPPKSHRPPPRGDPGTGKTMQRGSQRHCDNRLQFSLQEAHPNPVYTYSTTGRRSCVCVVTYLYGKATSAVKPLT
jgi:hypothetical protein